VAAATAATTAAAATAHLDCALTHEHTK
jgi:hypothetical protein